MAGSWLKSFVFALVAASSASAAESVDVAKALKGLPTDDQVFLLYEGTELMGQARLATTEGKAGLRVVELTVKRVARPNSADLTTWTRRSLVDRKGRLVQMERMHEGTGAAVATESVVFDKGVATVAAAFHGGQAPLATTVEVSEDVVSEDAVMAMVLAVQRPVEANWSGTVYDIHDRVAEPLAVHWTEPAEGEMEGISGRAQRVDIGDEGRHVVYWNGSPYQIYLPGGVLLMPVSKTDLEPAWDNTIRPRQEAAAVAEAFLLTKLVERTDGDAAALRPAVTAMLAGGTYKLEPTRIVIQVPEGSDDARAVPAQSLAGAIVDVRYAADGWSVKAWRPPEGAQAPKETQAEPPADAPAE